MLNISWPFLIRRLGLPPVYVSSSQLWCSRGLWGSNVLTTLSAPPVSVVAFSIYVFHFSQQWFVCPQSFPGSGSFQMSQFFASGGQSIGVSASTSVLSVNIQDWFPLGLTGWISSGPRDSQKSSPTSQFKSISSSCSAFLMVQLTHPHLTTGKTTALISWL